MPALQKFVLVAVLLISALNVSSPSATASGVNETTEGGEMVETWRKFEKRMFQITNAGIKMILPRLMESQDAMNLSSTCIRDSFVLIRGVRSLRPWAISFLDSSGKSIDGLLSGTIASYGNYDQCINTVVKNERSGHKDRRLLFHGKYCVLHIKSPNPSGKSFDDITNELKIFSESKTIIGELAKYGAIFSSIPLQLGLCVPSGCSLADINQLGKLVENYIYFEVTVARCEVKTKNEYPPVVIFMLCLFGTIIALALIGSLTDLYYDRKKHGPPNIVVKILLSFSSIANFKKLNDTNVSNDALTCLNGLRFITMTWIILGHTYLIPAAGLFNSLLAMRDFLSDFLLQAIVNGTVSVDTFFCIGGFLVCYLTMKNNESGKSFNIKRYIFHRLWRILPFYACAVGVVFLADLFGSGPLWHDIVHTQVKNCYNNWWKNLVFINNFYDAESACAVHGWFIACDMQLYIAALVVLIPLLRWPKVGLSIAGSGVISSMVYSGIWTYHNRLPTFLVVSGDQNRIQNSMTGYFFKPFVHAGPYCIGILAGHLLATRPKLQISKPFLVAGWCVAIITNISVLYGTFEWNRGHDTALWVTVLYGTCHRTAWAIGVAWVIVCCVTGHGGVVNKFLSWKKFIPLARLTFAAFLLHPYLIYITSASFKAQISLQHFFAVWMFLGHLCTTYAISLVSSIMIEAPFLSLERVILSKKEEKKTPDFFPTTHVSLGKPEI